MTTAGTYRRGQRPDLLSKFKSKVPDRDLSPGANVHQILERVWVGADLLAVRAYVSSGC